MKKRLSLFILVVLLLLPGVTMAEPQYIRPNNFLGKSGLDYTAELNRFQAQNNLAVTGWLDDATRDMLYNEKKISYDIIESPASEGYWIAVNKSRKALTVYYGKEVVNKYPLALGTSSTPTPSGKTQVVSRYVNPYWGGMNGKQTPVAGGAPNNPLGKRWLGLYLIGSYSYGIHGNSNAYSIGQYVSNGCIRMYNYDIETYVFPIIQEGTPVWVGTDQELASWGVRQIIDVAAEPVDETIQSSSIFDVEEPEQEPTNITPIDDTTSIKKMEQVFVIPN